MRVSGFTVKVCKQFILWGEVNGGVEKVDTLG
jgi:hypothetical protein